MRDSVILKKLGVNREKKKVYDYEMIRRMYQDEKKNYKDIQRLTGASLSTIHDILVGYFKITARGKSKLSDLDSEIKRFDGVEEEEVAREDDDLIVIHSKVGARKKKEGVSEKERKRLSVELTKIRAKIIRDLMEEGTSISDVGRILNMSVNQVKYNLKVAKDEDSLFVKSILGKLED